MHKLHRKLMLMLLVAIPITSSAQTNPVMFVTQTPLTSDFANVVSTFANHQAQTSRAPRGGDLYIHYPNGTLRNLTREAGFGVDGDQDRANAIAVRDPTVHWSGQRAVFAMVRGSASSSRWQIYEVTGLGHGQTARITRLPDQPDEYNNVSPIYDSRDRIIFASDRPYRGLSHLYPQLDEYESTPTVSGLYRLTPGAGFELFEDSPSGSFSPMVDSFGRVMFTRWDHLQRDQQNENSFHRSENFVSESSSQSTGSAPEVFPERRTDSSAVKGLRVNHFTPWQINQDGTNHLTVNHMGRHDFLRYFKQSFTNDRNLREFNGPTGNQVPITAFFMIREDPAQPGAYYAIDGPEFNTHSSGRVVRWVAAPGTNPENIDISYVTHPTTSTPGNQPEHSGFYRNPYPLSTGGILVAHTSYSGTADNIGTTSHPRSPYEFQIKLLRSAGNGYQEAGEVVVPEISKTLTWSNNGRFTTHTGPLWQLQPVEVVARDIPPDTREADLKPQEQSALANSGVSLAALKSAMREKDLALIVIRDATSRNAEDQQQPFNLQVPGGKSTIGSGGKVYDIAGLQIMQGDRIRGYGSRIGRRVLAQPLHDTNSVAMNNPRQGIAPGSVTIAADGSVAAFVPARRALSWQLVGQDSAPVVRERVWLSFAPGEVVTCEGCHGGGPTSLNQNGQGIPTNVPLALTDLISQLNTQGIFPLFNDGFE